MFKPFHLLPQFNTAQIGSYQRRWEGNEGHALEKKILEMIREGAGENFLQWEFEHHRLGFLEDMWDLKGYNIQGEDFQFEGGGGSGWFEAIDFSYAQLYHTKFHRAEFSPATFNFARIYNCEFIDCAFSSAGFYGAQLEKVKFINCNFIENNAFTNCDFRDVQFESCFIPRSILRDCQFDANTKVNDPIPNSHRRWKLTFDNKNLAAIFGDLKDGYSAGGVVKQGREYFFRQNQATTRYNTAGVKDTARGYLLEYLTGYGVRPLRVLAALGVLILLFLAIFSRRVGFENALILTTGGFFTFGGYVDLLDRLSVWYRLLYICTAFLGMFLAGLYVTVLANLGFRER